jgi:lipopolysaccharide export LptBFGC system permease protein LptF
VDTEMIAPRALASLEDIRWTYGSRAKPIVGFDYTDSEGDEVVSHVFAAKLDPQTLTLTGVVFSQYESGQPKVVVTAQSAVWRGRWLDLRGVQTWRMTADGAFAARAPRARYEVGDFPSPTEHRPEEMTIPQMRAWMAELRQLHAPVAQSIRPYEQAIAVRRATPWCALGFALVSAPLGIRRVRASTGVSLGMAVIVFVPYYFVAYTLQVLNKHGGIHPEIPAWTANILLFIIAGGLILDKSR